MKSMQDWGLRPFRYEELFLGVVEGFLKSPFFFFFLILLNSFCKQILMVELEGGLKAGVVSMMKVL